MLMSEDGVVISPTDLVDLLECEHRSTLTHALAAKVPGAPEPGSKPDAVVVKHGVQHELNALERFKARYDVVEIGTPAPHPAALREAARQTQEAMDGGAQAIYQGVFFDGRFYGRADFLIAKDGNYEPHDTKLARKASPSAVLQLTAYAAALGELAGPEMHLLLGDGTRQTYRVHDFKPLLTRLRRRLDERLAIPPQLPERLWGDERPACATCRFAQHCAAGRDSGRDLSLVAGMRTDQRRKLVAAGIGTIDELAVAETRPQNLSPSSFEQLRAQARMQVAQDRTNKISYELVGTEALAELPSPSEGDVFFDMEGDPFAGLEYLFGALTPDRVFTPFWAHDHAEEKKAFEAFVDFAHGRLQEHPQAHIYHYAPYELNALKRLANVHGTREIEVDELLRGNKLVDLYAVVRKALRVSQRSYSIKYLEPLYMPSHREGDVKTAVSSIEAYENYLVTKDPGILDEIADYNEYDCVSTLELYRFLLRIREEHGIEPVPPVEPDVAVDEVAQQKAKERAEQIARLVEPLLDAGHDLLAASVGYHRRETSPAWWEFFRQASSPLTDLETDSTCVVPMSVRADEWVEPTGRARTTKRDLTLRCDPERPHPFSAGEEVRLLYPGQVTRSAKVTEDSPSELVLTESVKPGETTPELPVAVLPGPPVRPQPKDEAVAELAEQAVALLPLLPQNPGIDLLLRTPPSRPLPQDDDLVAAVIKAVDQLDGGTLAVQGPPGAGKTYLAGRLITHLIAQGKTVGVTSNSHKAVENVLSSVDPGIPTAKRPKGKPVDDCPWEQPKDNGALVRWRAEHPGGHLVGGTAWTFANAALRADPFDVLIIDEAGQFALADAVAVATGARNLVLLGDPQQLPQVVQGTHPPGADASALGHLLGSEDVIPRHLGYFLDQTRRMHPDVCLPVSELSYQGLLHSHPVASTRAVEGIASGIYLRSVEHRHNITSSVEEADAVVDTVRSLIGRKWTDGSASRELTDSDILVVAPYNLQVRVTRRRLQKAGYDGVRVGTVDRFQGQEAPVVIMTMTSSSTTDLPRGLDFLLSRNRLNVALSRAQCVAVMICSPHLLDADIRGVDQMRLVAGTIGLIDHMRPWPGETRIRTE
ncbi:bifunctional RecB family nuclease/DEAD/DEAH box helicase [Lentzea sp. NBRC 105346]|uniref:TM0106 family RecB-like putative nuclease n=1 Tax=Lentzea sp. NBRC 105346 TaxID=3032205 RepID=UPI0025564904|nr:bifunctional RecB family nuclease/DEAD/DEAH box helicase [Lentzea sp. NBRC 105346]